MPSVHRSVLVPYSDAQMFALVEDVARYPEFLPWCGGSTVHERDAAGMVATVVIDFKGLRQSFSTRNAHEPPSRITLALREGPFSQLSGEWRFRSLRADACKVEFDLDYAFGGGLLGRALAPVFDQIAGSFVDAFVRRAEAVYRG